MTGSEHDSATINDPKGELKDYGVVDGQTVEIHGNMKSDTGDFAIVDVGGEYGLVAVSWTRLDVHKKAGA